jgi:hypothetical protein
MCAWWCGSAARGALSRAGRARARWSWQVRHSAQAGRARVRHSFATSGRMCGLSDRVLGLHAAQHGPLRLCAPTPGILEGHLDRGAEVRVDLPGGPLRIEWRADGHVYMTGPAERVFAGNLAL